MCDAEFDLVAEQWTTFSPLVREVLASGRPWAEELVLLQIEERFPGLCVPEPGVDARGAEEAWKVVARRILVAERAVFPPRSGLGPSASPSGSVDPPTPRSEPVVPR